MFAIIFEAHKKRGVSYYEIAHDISAVSFLKKENSDLRSALSVMLKNIEDEKKSYRDTIFAMLEFSIIPDIDKLASRCTDPSLLAYIQNIRSKIDAWKTSFYAPLRENVFDLSRSEVEVARLVAAGKSTKAISETLAISAETVSCHRKNIRKKCGIHNRKTKLSHYIASLMR